MSVLCCFDLPAAQCFATDDSSVCFPCYLVVPTAIGCVHCYLEQPYFVLTVLSVADVVLAVVLCLRMVEVAVTVF